MKIRPVGAEVFHVEEQRGEQADTQTWMKLIVAFRNFVKALKN